MTTIHCPSHTNATFAGGLRSLLGALTRRTRGRDVIRHLNELDDHVLRDIGFHRSIIAVTANAGIELVRSTCDRTEGV